MIIPRHHIKKKKQNKTKQNKNSCSGRKSKMKLVSAVQTSKKSTFESIEIRSLVKLDFGRLLVYGPNISVCRYPKTPWDSNAHCLN